MNTIKGTKKSAQLVAAAVTVFLALASMTAQANSLQTTLEQDEQGTRLVVVQKDAQGRELDMPPAQLGISPPSINLAAHGRTDTSVTFYNYSDEPKHIELSLVDADEQFKAIQKDVETLKSWTVIAPQTFTIAAGGYQTIRLSFRLPVASNQTYQGLLIINQKIDKSIIEQTQALTVVKIGSQYQLPIRLTVIDKAK